MLTKSNYLQGLQCPKLLWIQKNDKSRIPEIDQSSLATLEEGKIVGEYAKKLFPEGLDLSQEEFYKNIDKTKEALEKQIPIFEGGFLEGELYSRADILIPHSTKNTFDIIEVKSSTQVKDVNIHDVSFQKYVYEKAGLKIKNCYLMHINNQYVKDGEIEIEELFHKENITEKVEEFSIGIEDRIDTMIKIINKKEPVQEIGEFCFKPYECSLICECHKEVPKDSVLTLKGIRKKKAFELHNSGTKTMQEIADDVKLSEKQKMQKISVEKNAPHKDERNIQFFLENLTYPLYYLDFETIQFAIPRFDKSKPYQQIPFQYSLHIQNEPNGELIHKSFLANSTADPRQEFMQSLKENLGESGDILVYNQKFEKMILRQSAETFPEFQDWHDENILPRIKDLMDVFEKFWYYHPNQKGSTSIKKVLPLFSELTHKNLEIQKGDVASREFGRITYGEVNEEEAQRIRNELEEYCKLDTLAEVHILEGLMKLFSS